MRVLRKIRRFCQEPYIEKVATVSEWLWLVRSQLYYKRFFKHLGKGSKILRPLRLKNVHYMSIGDDVMIHNQCWLQTLSVLREPPELVIGNGSIIGNFNHITCASRVHLGEKVLTADRVFISDNGHGYEDSDKAILDQGVVSRGPVSIGAGTWLGENAVVLSCKIGRNCVIGANAAVVHDIPDYCVAVGTPARIIKRFNTRKKTWELVGSPAAP